jgi:1-deoxy-D-xylulose-5-phosphate reductoisomerase
MKHISVLGSTGSIGVNALRVIQDNPERYRALALAGGKNIDLLYRQIQDTRPEAVALLDQGLADDLRERCTNAHRPKIFFGAEGFATVATWEGVDTVVSGMTGAAGFLPTFAAIQAGKHVALANKETLVMAGPLVMREAKERDVRVLPIDSEHSAVLQSLQGHPREDVRRVILTASGGPFRDTPAEKLRQVTPAQALRHPTWDMGSKITIDSSTLMNKGLEVIEARWLFDLRMDQIHVLIHPQSVVHSMVEYLDGSVVAQMGVPDMTVPIAYALSCPHHLANRVERLQLEKIGTLTFERPDLDRFRCLPLALEAGRQGGTMPAVLNAANEIAVRAFIDGRIGFVEIPALIEKTMECHHPRSLSAAEDVMEADRWARDKASLLISEGLN